MNLLLFGQGLDPKYLHPSNMTCNADVALKSGEKIVLCHKAVLVTHVPYFKANFEEKSSWSYEQKVFSNTENDDKLEMLAVEIDSVQPEILCQFISFLYKNQVKFQKQEEEDSATENALQIFETANYFQEERISNISKKFLMKRISSKILKRLIPIEDFKEPISAFIQNMTDDETQIFKPGEIKNEEIQSMLQHFSEKTAAIFLNNLMMKPKSLNTGFSFGHSSPDLPFGFQTLLPLSAGPIVNTYLSKMNNMSSIEPFLTNFNWSNLEEQTRQIIFESLKCKLDQEIGGRVFKTVYEMQIDALRETMGALKIDANESGYCI